jgi:hypothetical protein
MMAMMIDLLDWVMCCTDKMAGIELFEWRIRMHE